MGIPIFALNAAAFVYAYPEGLAIGGFVFAPWLIILLTSRKKGTEDGTTRISSYRDPLHLSSRTSIRPFTLAISVETTQNWGYGRGRARLVAWTFEWSLVSSILRVRRAIVRLEHFRVESYPSRVSPGIFNFRLPSLVSSSSGTVSLFTSLEPSLCLARIPVEIRLWALQSHLHGLDHHPAGHFRWPERAEQFVTSVTTNILPFSGAPSPVCGRFYPREQESLNRTLADL